MCVRQIKAPFLSYRFGGQEQGFRVSLSLQVSIASV